MENKKMCLILSKKRNYTQIKFEYINTIVAFDSKYEHGSFLYCKYLDSLYYSDNITFTFRIVKIY